MITTMALQIQNKWYAWNVSPSHQASTSLPGPNEAILSDTSHKHQKAISKPEMKWERSKARVGANKEAIMAYDRQTTRNSVHLRHKWSQSNSNMKNQVKKNTHTVGNQQSETAPNAALACLCVHV